MLTIAQDKDLHSNAFLFNCLFISQSCNFISMVVQRLQQQTFGYRPVDLNETPYLVLVSTSTTAFILEQGRTSGYLEDVIIGRETEEDCDCNLQDILQRTKEFEVTI